jgi:C4-dicarboxylate-specific signal transduction histidine kinase
VLVSLKRIQSNRVHEYVLTIHDVSELKQAQLELERNNEELEQRVVARTSELQLAEKALNQSQRLASLGRMSSAIAHEINQPITALANYAASTEVLIERHQNEKALTNVDRIKGLIDRLSYISRQLRMVSGKRNTGVKPIKIRPIIAYAEDVLKQRLTETNVTVVSEITDTDRVLGNSMMLEQIVVNLMNNAIDALADIEAENNHEQPNITITREIIEDKLSIHISDNGKGLTEQEMEHLFEPFYTTKTLKQGLGLGLAISYNLASDMNGMLSVTSAKNSTLETTGATFTITLPIATDL